MITDIRSSLLKGRLQPTPVNKAESILYLPFMDSLRAATIEDLQWAMAQLISKPHVKRTHRNLRMQLISDKMMEKLHER